MKLTSRDTIRYDRHINELNTPVTVMHTKNPCHDDNKEHTQPVTTYIFPQKTLVGFRLCALRHDFYIDFDVGL